jgi:hypothetical protein
MFLACCLARQNVPTLTAVEQEQVYKILAFAKHKANADFLDSDFLTSNEHLEKYLGFPQPEKRMKAMANRRNVSTRDKVIPDKGKGELFSDKGNGKLASDIGKGKLASGVDESKEERRGGPKLLRASMRAYIGAVGTNQNCKTADPQPPSKIVEPQPLGLNLESLRSEGSSFRPVSA